MTIPETYFFRNPPQIRALGRQVLPELVRTHADTKRLVIWSAGCSTGEEPYTVAMLLLELIPDHKDWDIRIIATDVSQRALAAARRGRYGRGRCSSPTPSGSAGSSTSSTATTSSSPRYGRWCSSATTTWSPTRRRSSAARSTSCCAAT